MDSEGTNLNSSLSQHLEPWHDVDIDVLYPISVYADIGIMKRQYQVIIDILIYDVDIGYDMQLQY